MNERPNVDPAELEKFGALAARWWDPDGPMAPLHGINPLRLNFIERRRDLADLQVLDIGCGGGILSEAMAARGARVEGVDLTPEAIEAARIHLAGSDLSVNYRCVAAESLIEDESGRYDTVTCMELLEHVPEPAALVACCARLVKPGGELVFSTLNRNPKSFALAIVGAEFLLDLVPRGTHDYARFIKPSELAAWCRQAGLQTGDMAGLAYNPLTRAFSINSDVSVNYLMRCTRPA